MNGKRYQILVAIAVAIAAAIYLFQTTKGTGPLDIAQAERLVDMTLRIEVNRVETIAPDGELAKAPPAALRNVRAIDCPKLNSSSGTLPGRYGARNRTYGSAAFECLFTGESPSGTVLYFSTHVYRSADPRLRAIWMVTLSLCSDQTGRGRCCVS